MPDSWIGKTVGNCRIEKKIGEGGCGQVFRGVDLMLERPVAIKVLHGGLAARNDVAQRFRSEAYALARLSHPNVATLYSFHREGDTYLMVMEFVEGCTFDELIRAHGRVPLDQAIPLFCQALEGVHHAHEHGIIHRDLKGSNVMKNEAGVVKVMDFGIARALGSPGVTQADHPLGTPEYMSPEQIRNEDIDGRTDVYSLGVLLFKLLSGRLPFPGNNQYEIMRAQVEHEPPSIRDFVPSLPASVDEAILRALAKSRDERFASAAEFRASLEEALGKVGREPDPRLLDPPAGMEGLPTSDGHTTPIPLDELANDDALDRLDRHEGPTRILPRDETGAEPVATLESTAVMARADPIPERRGSRFGRLALAGAGLVLAGGLGLTWLAWSSGHPESVDASLPNLSTASTGRGDPSSPLPGVAETGSLGEDLASWWPNPEIEADGTSESLPVVGVDGAWVANPGERPAWPFPVGNAIPELTPLQELRAGAAAANATSGPGGAQAAPTGSKGAKPVAAPQPKSPRASRSQRPRADAPNPRGSEGDGWIIRRE